MSDAKHVVTESRSVLPAMFPCSQSTHTHSNPALAITLERLAPGSICHAPKEAPHPVFKDLCNRFAFFIMDAIVNWADSMACIV